MWEKKFHVLIAQELVDELTVMPDSTTVKVYQRGDGWAWQPFAFLLSNGNRNDICMAKDLLESFGLTGKIVLADKGYDSDKFVRCVKERGGIAVISSRVTAKHPRNIDQHIYKERHLIEAFFSSLKITEAVYFQIVTFISCNLCLVILKVMDIQTNNPDLCK